MTDTTSSDAVSYRLEQSTAVIGLDDGKANALSHPIIAAVHEALDRAAADDARAVVIAGRPGRFSAGFDLKVMTAGPDQALPLLKAGAELACRLYVHPTPVVVACTGHAVAMGAILLMASDVRVGTGGAFKVGMNEVAIGMPVPRFAVELARDRLAPTHFVPAIQLAQLYEPAAAVEVGYLDEVAEPDAVLDRAVERARELGEHLRAGAFQLTREIMRGALVARLQHELAEDLRTFEVEAT